MSASVHEPPAVAADGSAALPIELRSGALGTADITFIVVSAAAPLTVMAGVAPLAILVGGIGAPSAYLMAGVALVLFAAGFTAMTIHVPGAGGFYSYISHALGRVVGLGSAMLALLSYNALQIGIYGLLGFQAHDTLQTLWHIDVPWPVLACAGLVIVGLLGFCGVNIGAKVLGVLLTAETLILLIVSLAIVFQGGADGLHGTSFTLHQATAPGMAAVLGIAFAAFLGFESTSVYRREARRPERTIPAATYLAVIFLAVFYAFVAWTAVEAFGEGKVRGVAATHVADLFYLAADRYVGTWAGDTMRILFVTSVFAALLAFHNACNRYAYSLAGEGVLPKALAHTNRRFQSPDIAGAVQSVVALIVVLAFAIAHLDPYYKLLLLVNTPGAIGLIVLQALTSAAVFVYFVRNRRGHGVLRVIVAPIIAFALLGAAVYLAISKIQLLTAAGATANRILILLVPAVFVLGVVVALAFRWRRPATYAAIGTFGQPLTGAHANATTP